MKFSIIIPVWNGSDVLTECLNAVLEHSDSSHTEVICVDNASSDESAALLRDSFPQVKLLPQPVNLGFSGGVNAGMTAAQGELLILLNQDCIVAPGWLESLSATFATNQACGIVGAVIVDADGMINHAGAFITQPLGYGRHLLQVPEHDAPVDYVTGAIFAIRRSALEKIGGLDEDFYPAYYEESDYCYRARRHGIETYLSVDTHGRHLFSSREWKRDPFRHTANHHQSRYRFICKQFSDFELAEFVKAEVSAAVVESSFHESLGRVLASSYTLGHLDDILRRRVDDGNVPLASAIRRLLSVGLTDIYRSALHRSEQLATPQETEGEPPVGFEEWQTQLDMAHQQIKQIRSAVEGQKKLLDDHYRLMTGRERGAPPDSSLREVIQQARCILSGQQSAYLSDLQQQLIQYEELIQSLDHRMNLIETQVTLQEYRRRVLDQLLIYVHR